MGFSSPYPVVLLKRGSPICRCVCTRSIRSEALGHCAEATMTWLTYLSGTFIDGKAQERPGKNLTQLCHFTNEKIKARE
jgi:hypothetical protein